MQGRGVAVDHATINRGGLKYSPELEAAFQRRKRLVRVSWRMDETYIKVKGQWCYLYPKGASRRCLQGWHTCTTWCRISVGPSTMASVAWKWKAGECPRQT
jgi:DDE domain